MAANKNRIDDDNNNNDRQLQLLQQQERIIDEQEKTIAALKQRIKYLEEKSAEYDILRQQFAYNPMMTWAEANQMVMARQSALHQADIQQRNFEKQRERGAAEAIKQAEEEAAVLKAYPHIQQNYDKEKAKIASDKQGDYAIINRFFDMSHDDFAKYQSIDHKIEESPVQRLITINESKTAKYFCDADDSNHFTLSQIEEHIYRQEPDRHKAFLLKEIDDLVVKDYRKASAEFKQEIQDRIKAKRQQEYTNRMRQQAIKERRDKDGLPFVK